MKINENNNNYNKNAPFRILEMFPMIPQRNKNGIKKCVLNNNNNNNNNNATIFNYYVYRLL